MTQSMCLQWLCCVACDVKASHLPLLELPCARPLQVTRAPKAKADAAPKAVTVLDLKRCTAIGIRMARLKVGLGGSCCCEPQTLMHVAGPNADADAKTHGRCKRFDGIGMSHPT